jgi:rod shape-determining protein MreD
VRWPVALLFAYLALALELAISPALALGQTRVAPSFAVPFFVFIALFAPATPSLWTAVLLGLAVDLTSPRGPTGLVVPGPNALGFLVAAYMVLQVRGFMIRKNPLTLVFLAVVAAALAGLVVVLIFSLRGLYPDPFEFRGSSELWTRVLSAVYTAATAAVLALPLYILHGLFRFSEPSGRRVSMRSL